MNRTPLGQLKRVVGLMLTIALAVPLLVVASAGPAAAAAPFTVSNPTENEGNDGTKTITFTVTYTGSDPLASASYQTVDGTATAGEDYVAQQSEPLEPLTFTAIDDTEDVTIIINGDTAPENDETFFLDVTEQGVGGAGETSRGTATIFDDDVDETHPVPDLTVSGPTEAEQSPAGEPGLRTLQFTVTVNNPSGLPVRFDYATQEGSAKAVADFVPTSGTKTIPPAAAGQPQTTTVDVQVRTEIVNEGNETLQLVLSNPRNANVGPAGTATLTNDDSADVVLSPTYLDGWVQYGEECDGDFESTGTGQTFVVGPDTPPKGAGSLRFVMLSDPIDTKYFRTRNYDGYKLSDLTSLSYATYVETDGKQPPYFRLSIDLDRDDPGGTETADETLFFFPANNGYDAASDHGEWITWDGFAGAWNVNGDDGAENAVSLADYIADNPDARIAPTVAGGGTSILQGCGGANTTNSTTYVDLPSIGTTSAGGPAVTAYDLDPNAVFSFSAASYPVGENGGPAPITIRRVGRGGGTIDVAFTTSDGTATAPADYTDSDATVSFTPNDTSKVVNVPINDDAQPESAETVNLAITTAAPEQLGTPNTAVMTISDHEPGTVAFSSNGYQVNEDGTKVTITVNRTAGSTTPATVDYATSNGTAGAADYTATSGTLSFDAGETSETFDVDITDDALVEGDETFTVSLSNASGTAVGPPSTATVTIKDVEAGTVKLSAAAYSVDENGGKVTVTVTRSAGATTATDVPYTTGGGTATAGADYVDNDGTLSFAAGQLSRTVDVTITDDGLAEGNETFTFALGTPTGGASLAAPSSATVTIADVENGSVQLSATDYPVTEGEPATVTVQRTAGATSTATVSYRTEDGTAGSADYATTFGTLTFAPGETSKSFTVPTTDDSSVEGAETIRIVLGAVTNAAKAAPSESTITITDNDTAKPEVPQGYSLVGEDGSLYAFGTAKNLGDMRGKALNAPIIGVQYTPGGNGYWLVARDGGIFTFGDAEFFGSMGDQKLNAPVIGMAATPTGKGYWLFAGDGGIFTFGDAEFFGSMGDQKLNAPVINMEPLASGRGYWLVAADGGIFTFGLGEFFGSMGDQKINQPVFDMTSTDSDNGYWLVARDGGIFSFGDAGPKFFGSAVNETPRPTRVIGMDATPDSQGYWIADASGKVYRYGNAQDLGDRAGANNPAPMVAFAAVPSVKQAA